MRHWNMMTLGWKCCTRAVPLCDIFNLIIFQCPLTTVHHLYNVCTLFRLWVCWFLSVTQVEYKLLLIELHIMKSLQVDNTVSWALFEAYCLMYRSWVFVGTIVLYCLTPSSLLGITFTVDACSVCKKHIVQPVEIWLHRSSHVLFRRPGLMWIYE